VTGTNNPDPGSIQKILAVIDPTAIRQPCVEKAARLAAAFGSLLELYICDTEQNIPQSWAGGTTLAQYRGVLRERRLAMLEALAAPLREHGIHVITETQWSAPLARSIVEHAIRSQADLVVKDTPRHTPPVSFAQADWILLHHLPMPLLLVRRKEWADHPVVAACVDPCHGAERPPALDDALLAMSCSLGRALSGDVSVLHALEGPAHLPDETPDRATIEAAYELQREAVLQVAKRANVPGEELHFQDGHFPESLFQLVRNEKPDVLVMGVAARQKFHEGGASTASEVLEQTDCDLLVMKPPGFVSPALVSSG
jgi:universal stress protein E